MQITSASLSCSGSEAARDSDSESWKPASLAGPWPGRAGEQH